jgi:subtilisin family serine protease
MDRASVIYRVRSRALRLVLPVSALLALTLVVTATRARADGGAVTAADRPADQAQAVPGELIVGFNSDASASETRRAVASAGGKVEEKLGLLDGAVVASKGGRSTEDVAATLEGSDAVDYVEPNYLLHASRVPNDPAFGKLWGLRNVGQFGGNPGADIGATAAWDVATGGDITVAVVDTGLDYRHPDLVANTWTNPSDPANGQDDDGDGFVDDVHGVDFINDDSDPMDDSGHGTHVAGIVGARGDNSIGTVGVNWSVRIMPLKFLDRNGDGNTADAAQAIAYAVDHGAKVINASWGGTAFSQTLYQAVANASDHGVLLVSAAGNEGANGDVAPDYPAGFSLPNVISVAATDRNDRLLDFSNYGRRTVQLAAPGDEIDSTVPPSVDASGYTEFSGTSMAAPFVSGAAALYLSRWPGSSVGLVRDALLRTTVPLPSLEGKTSTGGRLDVARALGFGHPGTPGAVPSTSPPSRDVTAPSRFKLLRPRNRYASHRRAIRFRWQRSTDRSGIRYYKLFIDGKRRKTLRNPSGPGGHGPHTKIHLKLRSGRHRWTVKAYDYAGNCRRAGTSGRRHAGRASILYIGAR